MPLYKCNSDTGSQITGRGVIKFGDEFSVPSSEPPRASWIPLDDSARAVFAAWNKAHPDAPRHPRPDKLPPPKVNDELEETAAALKLAQERHEMAISNAKDVESAAKRRAAELKKYEEANDNAENSLPAQAQVDLQRTAPPVKRGRAADGG